MKIKLLIIIIALVLSGCIQGCASNDRLLVSDSGKQYRCRSTGYGIIGTVVANSNYEDCVKNAQEKGYK